MKKERNDLKILLLQIREDRETSIEEYYEFLEFGKLYEEQLTVLNTFERPDFEPTIINDYDALFVGGSSDATVLEPITYPFISNSKKLLHYCYDKKIPVLASCFGFQVVIEELGGKIILDEANMEMGTYPIQLTAAAKDDPLLYDIPSPFWGISGHKERAVSIPTDAILMAYTTDCPYHLIKFIDKPFYAFQFHPEVSCKDLIARITRYQIRYLDNPGELQQIIDASIHETTESNALISKFIDRIILPKINCSE